jgi:hypothetical protein
VVESNSNIESNTEGNIDKKSINASEISENIDPNGAETNSSMANYSIEGDTKEIKDDGTEDNQRDHVESV